jgi:putative transposase
MTEDRLPLAELLAKSGDGDALRSAAEAGGAADADGGRRGGPDRRRAARTHRRAAELAQRLPRPQLRHPARARHAAVADPEAAAGRLLPALLGALRQGGYFPPFLEPRKTSEKALVAVVQEAWIGGVSTRRVDELVQAMGLSGISKSTVSKLCRDIDERVGAFLDRPLAGEWRYLWLDATHLRQREGGRIVSVAAIIAAVACDAEGRREIVGLHIGPSEAETFWASSLKSLVKRGLKGVKLVVSDAHEGLKAALARVLGATWQRCRVHWMRNALAHVGKAQQSMAAAALRPPGLPATRPGQRPADLAPCGRPAPSPLAEARQAHGRQRGGRARLHGVPGPAQDQAAQHEHP